LCGQWGRPGYEGDWKGEKGETYPGVGWECCWRRSRDEQTWKHECEDEVMVEVKG